LILCITTVKQYNMKTIKPFQTFLNESDWGSSDQNIMMQSIHKGLSEPSSAPGLDPVLTAAEEAVDFYWEDWEEYKTDRAGLINKAAKDYYRKYFPEWLEGMQKMFKSK